MTTRSKIAGLNREIAGTEHETAVQDVNSNAGGIAEDNQGADYDYDDGADETSYHAGVGQYVAPTLLLVAMLCVGQLLWTLLDEHKNLGGLGIAGSLFAVLLCLLGFEGLRAFGAQLVQRNSERRSAAATTARLS